MLQLMDLARENAALKCELERIRQEAEELQRLFSGAVAISLPPARGRRRVPATL